MRNKISKTKTLNKYLINLVITVVIVQENSMITVTKIIITIVLITIIIVIVTVCSNNESKNNANDNNGNDSNDNYNSIDINSKQHIPTKNAYFSIFGTRITTANFDGTIYKRQYIGYTEIHFLPAAISTSRIHHHHHYHIPSSFKYVF